MVMMMHVPVVAHTDWAAENRGGDDERHTERTEQ